jgi:hypothetical protein
MTTPSEPQEPGRPAQAGNPADVPAGRPASLDRFDVLIGRWEMEATFEGGYS